MAAKYSQNTLMNFEQCTEKTDKRRCSSNSLRWLI